MLRRREALTNVWTVHCLVFLLLVLGVFFVCDSTTQTRLTSKSLGMAVNNHSLYRSLARRVILHIDMDAFYAQVEHRRTGIAREEPLAVQQWEGLIAVNYAARARGISRHMNVKEAKKVCPELHCVHVEVISGGKGEGASGIEGEELAAQLGRGEGKVSLGRYRTASAEVFATLQRFGTVEKASIDEAYLDVTQEVEALYRSVKKCKQDRNSEDDGEEAASSRDSADFALTAAQRELKDVQAFGEGELSLESTGSNLYGDLDSGSVDSIKLLLGELPLWRSGIWPSPDASDHGQTPLSLLAPSTRALKR